MAKNEKFDVGIEQCLVIALDRVEAVAAQGKVLKRSLRAGAVDRSLEAALDIEPLIREANSAIQAASLLRRGRTRD
jgi:hypothetical protein